MPSIDPPQTPIDFSRYLSKESTGRIRSQLKQLRPYLEIPGLISFGGGYPNPSTWPCDGMILSVPFAEKSVYVPGYGKSSPSSMPPLEAYVAPTKGSPLSPNLAAELQYSSTYGHPHFTAWAKEHIARVHSPKYPAEEWNVLATAGNTDGVDAILRSCFDKGEYFLVEEFAYPGLLTHSQSIGLKPLGVPMDTDGIDPAAMDEMLSSWDAAARGGPRPKMTIIVPTCSNPCGITVPEQRKREILAVCRKWDMLLVEDDPYCFLQTRPHGAAAPIVPTFLSLDTEGRVLRIDSFSKIVAPGSRLGFITGHKALVEKIMQSREASTQNPSGWSVAAVTAILRAWGGHEGFENKYLPYISDVYTKRCHLMISLLSKHLPPACADIPTPSGGMFLWLRLKVETHPLFLSPSPLAPDEITQKIFEALIAEKVLAAPSKYFKAPRADADGEGESAEEQAKRQFLRLSFSLPDEEAMEEGVKRMARAFKREWALGA